MANEDFKAYLSKDGQMDLLDDYVLCVAEAEGIHIYLETDLGGMYMATATMHNTFMQSIASHSDQDIYEFCKEFDIEYDTFMELVREERANG